MHCPFALGRNYDFLNIRRTAVLRGNWAPRLALQKVSFTCSFTSPVVNDHFLHTPPILKTLFVSFHRWRIHLIKHSKKAKGTCDQRAHSVSNNRKKTQTCVRLLTLFSLAAPRRRAVVATTSTCV